MRCPRPDSPRRHLADVRAQPRREFAGQMSA